MNGKVLVRCAAVPRPSLPQGVQVPSPVSLRQTSARWTGSAKRRVELGAQSEETTSSATESESSLDETTQEPRQRPQRLSSARQISSLDPEDQSFDWRDFFRGELPKKLAILLGMIAFSRVGVYIRLPGVDVDAFAAKMQSGGFLGYVDTLSGGSISRVGFFSLGSHITLLFTCEESSSGGYRDHPLHQCFNPASNPLSRFAILKEITAG